jgi:hypothetical protein
MTGLTNDPDEARGSGVDPATGQQRLYWVLSDEERAKGFVRPVRRSYVHAKELGGCGAVTTMGQAIAETYAVDPKAYSGTLCASCGAHFPVGENGQFKWDGAYDPATGEYFTDKVGT